MAVRIVQPSHFVLFDENLHVLRSAAAPSEAGGVALNSAVWKDGDKNMETRGKETLREMIEESGNIVFFGGAGVSTESGIPDFRSADGLYFMKYDYPPEEILSRDFFERNPEEFYRFYRDKILVPSMGAKPNAAHLRLAELEKRKKLCAVVTQNIDGLHDDAGSKNVLELHGSTRRNYCVKCGKRYTLAEILAQPGIPHCRCGGIIRPDVVLYGEGLDPDVLEGAVASIASADMLIIAGTSLAVYPAAGLIRYFRGRYLVLINKSSTPMDDRADLVIREKVGEVLGAVCGGMDGETVDS